MSFLWAAVAGTLSGMIGAMGLGGGGVLIIYLTLFLGMEQGIAQGVNLIFFIPSAVIALIIYSRKKMIAWKAAIPAAVLGVAGAWLGTYLSSLIDGYWLSKLFGGLLLIMGVMQLFYKKEKGGDSADSKKDLSSGSHRQGESIPFLLPICYNIMKQYYTFSEVSYERDSSWLRAVGFLHRLVLK